MKAARAVAFTAALCAASCGAPLMKLPAGPGAPAADALTLLEQATTACRAVATVSAEVAVSGSIGGRRVRGRLLAGLASPASVYIEAPAPFGAPLFVLGASDGDATLLLPRDRRVLEHGRPDQVLEAIAGVPLEPAELKATLTGCVAGPLPQAADARAVGDGWRIIGGNPERYLQREKGDQSWHLAAEIRPGPSGWRTEYRNFDAGLPRSIRLLSNQPRRFDLRLQLSQVDLNEPLEPGTFRVAIPPGTEPISISDLRANGPLSR